MCQCGQLWAALGSSGQLWAALGSSGQLWAALGSSGQLWAALDSSGQLGAAVGSSGQLWAAVGSCGQLWAAVGRLHASLTLHYSEESTSCLLTSLVHTHTETLISTVLQCLLPTDLSACVSLYLPIYVYLCLYVSLCMSILYQSTPVLFLPVCLSLSVRLGFDRPSFHHLANPPHPSISPPYLPQIFPFPLTSHPPFLHL